MTYREYRSCLLHQGKAGAIFLGLLPLPILLLSLPWDLYLRAALRVTCGSIHISGSTFRKPDLRQETFHIALPSSPLLLCLGQVGTLMSHGPP